MIIRLFLLPLILCLLWWGYLHYNGWSVKEGRKGFYYILGIGGAIGAYLSLMLWLTQ